MTSNGHKPARACARTSAETAAVAQTQYQIGNVVYHVFSKRRRPDLFEAYLAIRYQVFVVERGWSCLAHSPAMGVALEDAWDNNSLFCVAETGTAGAVCVLRGTMGDTENELPHQGLYERHLESEELRPLREHVATLNSLAVLKQFRGMSVASAAMILLVDALWQRGARIIFGSVEPSSTSARLCAHLGFRIIDPPYEYDLPGVEAMNIALVIGERRRELLRCLLGITPGAGTGLTEGERAAIEYSSRRERTLATREWCKRLVHVRRTRFAD